jgi:hypothetical protein
MTGRKHYLMIDEFDDVLWKISHLNLDYHLIEFVKTKKTNNKNMSKTFHNATQLCFND